MDLFKMKLPDAAYEYQIEMESGEQVMVGVNRFAQEEEQMHSLLFRVDDRIRLVQMDKLKSLKE